MGGDSDLSLFVASYDERDLVSKQVLVFLLLSLPPAPVSEYADVMNVD